MIRANHPSIAAISIMAPQPNGIRRTSRSKRERAV